jgi:hypothetical protein
MKRFLLFAIFLLACAGEQTLATAQVATVLPATTTSPLVTAGLSLTATPLVAPGKLTPTEAKYRLLQEFGTLFFCDPDEYPVARLITDQELDRRVSEIEKNAELSQTIAKHLGFIVAASKDQKQAFYAEYKKLNAIQLEVSGDKYKFALRVAQNKANAQAIEGTIDQNSRIVVTKRENTIATCPICLARDTLIDTPQGARAIQDLKTGDPIWTRDSTGLRREAVVTHTVSRPVSVGATILHLTLADRRTLSVSAAHPMINGQAIGSLFVGDLLDGSQLLHLENIATAYTYDILPSGDTGAYWANGILLRSTIR